MVVRVAYLELSVGPARVREREWCTGTTPIIRACFTGTNAERSGRPFQLTTYGGFPREAMGQASPGSPGAVRQ